MLVSTRAGSAARLLVFRTPLHWRLSLKPSFTSSNSVLVLAGSSIACRTSALVAGCRAPQDRDSHWGGLSVAKARSWKAVVGP